MEKEITECEWENCSGGEFCPKHSLLTNEDLKQTISSLADAIFEKAKEEPVYQMMNKSKNAGEVLGIAENVMARIALDVSDILSDKFGVEITKEKLLLLYKLPYLMSTFEKEEEHLRGRACCVDRACARVRELIL